MEKIIFLFTLMAALGSGLIAGTFFVFSVAIMRAFAQLPPAEGMRAMQTINVVILNPAFLGVFLGTAVLSAVVAVLAVLNWSMPSSAYFIAGAVLYIVGSLVVTMVFNVPLNNTLAAADPASPEGQEIWTNYLSNWIFWNHIRTLASLAAAACFIIGLWLSSR